MTEVELRIIANNKSAVQGLREVNTEAKKVGQTEEQLNTKRKGFIEGEEARLKRLREMREKTYHVGNLKFYNQEIERTQKKIKAYQEEGLKVEKQGNTLVKTFSQVAGSLYMVGRAFTFLKGVVLESEIGLNRYNVILAQSKQLIYDIVHRTPMKEWIQNMKDMGTAQKELNDLRAQERKSVVYSEAYHIAYNRFLVEAKDHTKTLLERTKSYDAALIALNKSIDINKESTQKRLNTVQDMLKKQGDSEALLNEESQLILKLMQLEDQRYAGQKEIASMRTGLIQQEKEEREKLQDEIILMQLDGINKELKAAELKYQKDIEEYRDNLKMKKLLTQRYYLELMAIQKKYAFTASLDPLSGETQDIPVVGPGINQLKFSKAVWDLNKKLRDQADQQADDDAKAEEERREKQIQAIKEFVSEVQSILQSITDRAVEDAQRQRELLDTQVAEAQRAMDTEVELYKAGYASNVSAKEAEVERLKKLREQALADEEKALERQRKLDTLTQTSSLITASAETIKAFPGPLLPIAIAIIATMFGAFIAAKAQARNITKLAEGGHGSVKGRLHSEGGEPFLSHVEVEEGEDWGVLNRNATRKYGKVFARMVDSFNKDKLMIPKSPGVKNDIRLDTSATNSRLDILTGEVRKLNNFFEAQEQTSDNGNNIISRKGQTVRIIKRR